MISGVRSANNFLKSTINLKGQQQLTLNPDTIKVKQPVVKLNIPKTNVESKLQEINETFRELTVREERVVQNKFIKQAEPDTLPVKLYEPDTISFLIGDSIAHQIDQTALFFIYPEYKPHQVIDTNYRKTEVSNKVQEKTLAKGKGMITHEPGNNYSEIYSATWIPVFLIVVFLFMAWIRVFYSKVLRLTIRSSYNSLISNRLFRERNTITIWGSQMLNLLFFAVGGFFIFLMMHYFGYHLKGLSEIQEFFIVSLALVILYLLKSAFLFILGAIYNEALGTMEYIHNIFIYNRVIGILIIPAIITIPYIPEPGKEIFIKAGIILFILAYILRIFRGLKIGYKISVSIFYMILYLCTLEFLPLLILYKVFVTYTS